MGSEEEEHSPRNVRETFTEERAYIVNNQEKSVELAMILSLTCPHPDHVTNWLTLSFSLPRSVTEFLEHP